MSGIKYVFDLGNESKPLYKDRINIYQFAHHPKNGKHEVRKIKIDEYNKIYGTDTRYITEGTYKRMRETLPENSYRIYSVYSLKNIKLPNLNEIMFSRSPIFNSMSNDNIYDNQFTNSIMESMKRDNRFYSNRQYR